MSNTIIKNLTDAHDILSMIEEPVFDLQNFKQVKECGTIACAAGWLAMSDRFAPIMRLEQTATCFYGLLSAVGEPKFNEYGGYDFSWLDAHFGPDAFDNLFTERGSGARDMNHPDAVYEEHYGERHLFLPDEVTDKELALWRIRQQIAAIEGSEA